MIHNPDREEIRPILERNRPWCAYALADLDPAWYPNTSWAVAGEAVRLIYSGLQPPVVFIDGPPLDSIELVGTIPEGRYQFTLLGIHRSQFADRLQPEFEAKTWRMVLRTSDFPKEMDLPATRRLWPEDERQISDLIRPHPDRPDSFHIDQVAAGQFYGVVLDGRLVSMAGTHVLSDEMSVAALGNVFTDPEFRGRGYGLAASHAVTDSLLVRGIETVVLNVAMENAPALAIYRKLGFWPFCGYYEGVAWIASENRETSE